MGVPHELIVVAFLRGVGGHVRLLLAVDRAGTQLFDGEPAILVEHRPGRAASTMTIETAAVIDDHVNDLVLHAAAEQLVAIIEAAFDEQGAFDGERIVAQVVAVELPASTFESGRDQS